MANGIYSTGTISVTNGSTAVAGVGTAFVSNVNPGALLLAPNGEAYFVASVSSDTALVLTRAYTGTSQTGQAYEVAPTGGVSAALSADIQSLISDFESVVDNAGEGKFDFGSIGAPGVRFVGDEDTGMRRPASNQVALTAGGIDYLKASSAGIVLTALLSGTAIQSSAFAATSGQVLSLVGASGSYGLGGSGQEISDYSSLNGPSRIIAGAGSGVTDAPPDNGAYRPGFVVHRASSDRASALAFGNNGLAMRNYEAGVPDADWNVLFAQQNILGTVAQASGMPTGALIEAGSNANGNYVRFADGTQICWTKGFTTSAITIALGSVFRPPASTSWTYPAAFTSAPVVRGAPSDLECICSNNTPTATSVSLRILSFVSKAGSVTFDAFAVGRWF